MRVALALSKEAEETARRSRMPQPQSFALSGQAQALVRLGRLEEAVRCSTRAVGLLATLPQRVGIEEILFAHARIMLTAYGREEASPFVEMAYEEVQRKAGLIRDPGLRKSYLNVPPASDIVALTFDLAMD